MVRRGAVFVASAVVSATSGSAVIIKGGNQDVPAACTQNACSACLYTKPSVRCVTGVNKAFCDSHNSPTGEYHTEWCGGNTPTKTTTPVPLPKGATYKVPEWQPVSEAAAKSFVGCHVKTDKCDFKMYNTHCQDLAKLKSVPGMVGGDDSGECQYPSDVNNCLMGNDGKWTNMPRDCTSDEGVCKKNSCKMVECSDQDKTDFQNAYLKCQVPLKLQPTFSYTAPNAQNPDGKYFAIGTFPQQPVDVPALATSQECPVDEANIATLLLNEDDSVKEALIFSTGGHKDPVYHKGNGVFNGGINFMAGFAADKCQWHLNGTDSSKPQCGLSVNGSQSNDGTVAGGSQDCNFTWTKEEQACTLNGNGYPLQWGGSTKVDSTNWAASCVNNKYKSFTGDKKKDEQTYYDYYEALLNTVLPGDAGTSKLYEEGVFVQVKVPGGDDMVWAMVAVGHGVLDGACGDLHLIRFDEKYVILFQKDVRTWSLEMSKPAADYLSAKNDMYMNCLTPSVVSVTIDDVPTLKAEVQKVQAQKQKQLN